MRRSDRTTEGPPTLRRNVGGALGRRPRFMNITPGGRGSEAPPTLKNVMPGGRSPAAPPTPGTGPRRVLLLRLDSRPGTDLVGRMHNDEVTGLQGAEDLDHTPLCRASTDVDPLGPSVADKDDEDSLSRCFDGTAVQIS